MNRYERRTLLKRIEYIEKNPEETVRSLYGFKRLTAKRRATLGTYQELASKEILRLQTRLQTVDDLKQLLTSKKGSVNVSYENRDLLHVMRKNLKFKNNEVIKMKAGDTYYIAGSNVNKNRFLDAVNTDFVETENTYGSDVAIANTWKTVGDIVMSYGTIKGKVGGGYFDKTFKPDVAYIATLARYCGISIDTTGLLVVEDRFNKNVSVVENAYQCEVKKRIRETDNCLQYAIQMYCEYYKLKPCNALIEHYAFKDNIDRKALEDCKHYDVFITLDDYDSEKRVRTHVFGNPKSEIKIVLALINKHYIPVLPVALTSYYLTYYDIVKGIPNANTIVAMEGTKYIKDKTNQLTTVKALHYMLENPTWFFIENSSLLTGHDFISENKQCNQDMELTWGRITERLPELKKSKVIHEYLYADFETYHSIENKVNLEPILCHVRNDKLQETFIGSNCGYTMLDRLLQWTGNIPKLIFHNLKFDLNVLLQQDNRDVSNIQMTERGGLLMFASLMYKGRRIDFQDSRAYLEMPLKQFSTMFDLEYFKEILPYNYYVKGFKEVVSVNEFMEIIKNRYDADLHEIVLRNSRLNKTTFEHEKTKYLNTVIHDALDVAERFGLFKNHKKHAEEFVKLHHYKHTVKDYMELFELTTLDETINMMEYNAHYCRADCLLLQKGMEKFQGELNTIVFDLDEPTLQQNYKKHIEPFCLSKDESISLLEQRKELLENFKTTGLMDYKTISSIADAYMKINGAFDSVFNISGTPRAFISKASCGGRVQSYFNQKIHIVNKIIADLDGVSLYPSAMKRLSEELGGILQGTPKILKEHQLTKQFLDSVDGYFIEIKILKVVKERGISVLGLRLDEKRHYCDKDLKDCFVVVDKITLEMLIEYNQIEYKILKGYYYNEGRNPVMGKLIQELFELRLKAKAEGNEGMSNTIKLMMNSAYGKCGMKAIDLSTKYVRTKKFESVFKNQANTIYSFKDLVNGFTRYEKQNDITTHLNSVHVSCEILSMSKRIMNEVIYLAEDNNIQVYYTDTDSIHIDYNSIDKLKDLYLHQFKHSKHHNYGELLGKQLGQFHNDFDTPYFKGSKKELVSVECILLGAKTYIDKITPIDNIEFVEGQLKLKQKYLFDYHERSKGINTDCIKDMSRKEFKGDDFKIYNSLLKNEKMNFDLSVEGQRASFKLSNFNPINNHINRTIQFVSDSYVLYDGKNISTIPLRLKKEDIQDLQMKTDKTRKNIEDIKRI